MTGLPPRNIDLRIHHAPALRLGERLDPTVNPEQRPPFLLGQRIERLPASSRRGHVRRIGMGQVVQSMGHRLQRRRGHRLRFTAIVVVGEQLVEDGTRLNERGGIDGIFDFQLEVGGGAAGQHFIRVGWGVSVGERYDDVGEKKEDEDRWIDLAG